MVDMNASFKFCSFLLLFTDQTLKAKPLSPTQRKTQRHSYQTLGVVLLCSVIQGHSIQIVSKVNGTHAFCPSPLKYI